MADRLTTLASSMSNTTRFSDPIKAHELQGRSNALLETIYATDIKSDLPLDETKVLKQAYNRLSCQLDALEYSVLSDPLAILPPEIWGDILYEATRKVGTSDPQPAPVDTSLVLTLVNKDWRAKILDTPGLWTDIEIGKGSGDGMANLETALRLSKDLGLSVTIHFIRVEWLVGFPLLALHRDRIRRLTLLHRNRDRMAVWPSDSVDQFFSVVGPLSSLQFMEDDFPPYSQLNWEYILSQCPAFVGIKRHLDDRSPRGHTQFWVHESTAPLKDFILQLKGLGHARTLRWWPDKGIEEEIHLADHDVPSLPALTDCVIGRGINQNLYKILKSARNLTYLSIHIGDKWRHVFDLLDLCTHLPKLLTLHLTISTISEQLTAHMVHSSATNIRDLGLNYIGGQEYDEIKNMGIFFSLLPEYFGHLQDLYVSPTDLGPQLATFIASLSHLRSLYLGQMSLCNIENVVTSSPSLEILRIELKDAGTSQELLSSTNFPLLRCLKVSLSSYSRDFNVERIDLNFGSILGHLTTVHIDAPDVQWDLPDFPALRRLHVGSQYAAPATEFLANLILEPKICGLLHEIELNFIPEWDLLFLMLERRNYLPPSLGISRITTLILQSPIPPFLLAPLTYLLRGRFTERPSNLDLSFCNFMEEYFDTSLPGCWVCLRSFLPCEAPAGIYTTDQIIKPRFRPLTLLSGQFDIPTNVWEWLQDRDSRVSRWQAFAEKERPKRESTCVKMRVTPSPSIITARYFSGLYLHDGE